MIGSPYIEKGRVPSSVPWSSSMQSGRAPESNGQVDVTSLPPESDIVTTAAEINEFHGTGTLLFRIFPDASSIISLRTSNFYDGNQTLELPATASRFRVRRVQRSIRGSVGISAALMSAGFLPSVSTRRSPRKPRRQRPVQCASVYVHHGR